MSETEQMAQRLSARMERYNEASRHDRVTFEYQDYSAMQDAAAMLSELWFEECEECQGTGYDCKKCEGHGTLPVWGGPHE